MGVKDKSKRQAILKIDHSPSKIMRQELEAVFDGTALQPEEPLNLATGTRVRIIIESVASNEVKLHKTFLQTAQSLKLQGEPDWSEKIDQYIYGKTLSDND
jgi:predicted DNA-binding antitoxin AbrB/MazE fold protein